MKHWNSDPYTVKARKENLLARSAFKIEEIVKKEPKLRTARRVVDLGASPGAWSDYCLKFIPQCEVWAIDLKPLKLSHRKLHFIQGDFLTAETQGWLNGEKADAVLSDMAPNTSGVHDMDVARSLELCEAAFQFAKDNLKHDGVFVCKVFMGSGFEEFKKTLSGFFKSVRLVRPDSTRKHSREIFVLASGVKNPDSSLRN